MTFESFVFVFIYMKVVAMVNHYFPEKQVDLVKIYAWAFFPIMLVFIAGSFIEPDTFYRSMRGGEETRLGGWIMNPNELGMLASIAAAMAYLYMTKSKEKSKVWGTLMIIAAIVVLALTSSRSSAIGFLLIIDKLLVRVNYK